MLQRIIMILLILVIVMGGGLYAYKELMPPPAVEARGPVYSTRDVVRGNLNIGVEAVGNLEPSSSGGIRVPGTRGMTGASQYAITEFLVKEGDSVKQGQTIAILSSASLEENAKEKQEQLLEKTKQLADICQVPAEQVDKLNPAKGITITSPIDGRVTDLKIEEGNKLELGTTIARVIDNTVYRVEIKLHPPELQKVKQNQNVILRFDNFDGDYEGTVTYINPNPVPLSVEKVFAGSFVHNGIVEAVNEGLVQRDMQLRVGVKQDNGTTYFLTNPGVVKGFMKEERVINTIEAIVTKRYVDNMALVKKGDPIITMSGTDVQDMVQKKLDEIWKLRQELKELTSQLAKMEIKAPMDGIIAAFMRPVGDAVDPGEWIGHLYSVSDMRMWPMVDDLDILHIKQGAAVKVTVDAIRDRTFKGEVTNVSTMAEPVNGISKFRIEIKVEGDSELRPGMQAKAFIDAGNAQNALLIPLEAIFEEDGKNMVEILKPDGTTSVVPVKLGLMNDRQAEVLEGLKEGDKVVTGSTADLMPSQHIKSEGSLLPEKTGEAAGTQKEGTNGK